MRSIIWIILSLVLIGLAGFTWWKSNEEKKKMEAVSWDRRFAIKDQNSISKVILTKRGAESIVLEKNENAQWRLNGKYDVFPNAINNFLEVASNLSIQSIPPKSAYDGIMREFAAFGIKVQFFDPQGEIIKTYYVGGVTSSEEGLYALMEGSQQPYAVELGKSVANLRYRYDIKLDDWRDRYLFKTEAKDIKTLIVQFPFAAEESFRIENANSKYQLYDAKGIEDKTIDQLKLKKYLSAYGYIGTEAIENNNKDRDSISRLIPYMHITMVGTKGDTSSCAIYPINEQTGHLDLSKEFLTKGELFRLFANRNDGDFFLLQYVNLGAAAMGLSDLKKI